MKTIEIPEWGIFGLPVPNRDRRCRMMQVTTRSIFDVDVVELEWQQALAFARAACDGPEQSVIAFLNANNANIAMRDADYRQTLDAAIVLPDGVGVDIASRALHGTVFPANLNGTDFVPALLTYITEPKRVALLGARPGVADGAVETLRQHAPWHSFIAVADGFFDRSVTGDILDRIAEVRPDILLVGMGSPDQEKWVRTNVGAGHGRLVLSVGALFDFLSGTVPRAPAFIRRLRLEWLYRLMIEPSRLWRRYILGVPLFLFYVARARLLEKKDPRVAGRARAR